MLHGPDHDHLVRLNGIVNAVRESVDEVASNVGLDGSPCERIGDDRANTRLDFIDEGVAQTRNLSVVELARGDEFRQRCVGETIFHLRNAARA